MKKWLLTGLMISLALGTQAQAPEMFRYQGRLVDGTNLVNANLPMNFKLYDALSNGTLLYEDASSVQVVDGLYSTFIGDNTVSGSLTGALTNTAVYLELTVNGETLSPRERLVSVPYALNTKADPTPSGTIVLSATYPNPELEARGYSQYYEDVTQADWEGVEYTQYFDPYSCKIFGFGNQIGTFSSYPIENNLYLTDDGKLWDNYRLPIETFGYAPTIIEINSTLYFFSLMGSYSNACSTTDLQIWDVWTNYFGGSEVYPNLLEEIIVFKNALWAFVRDPIPTSYVMRSTDGINWTTMSVGSWGDLNMYGNVVADENKMWISSQDPLTSSNRVWSSADGISWKKSLGTTPSYNMETPKLVSFDHALWSFTRNESPEGGGICWKSTNDGDSWSLVSTNVPNYTLMSGYQITVHENKLWLVGTQSSGTTSSAVMWSTNGADWNPSLNTNDYLSDYASLISLPNGRLWFYNSGPSGTTFYYIGGPKVQDGLYYYQKD
ncbi:MAG: hypothetical protein K9M54_13490 [Kiritimatiellales bacterium]|nr:hypothetical protein [Kiritimatiellales bacterium]